MKQSASACTMPSPGFGIRRMSSDMAAPIPVRIIPAASTAYSANVISPKLSPESSDTQ